MSDDIEMKDERNADSNEQTQNHASDATTSSLAASLASPLLLDALPYLDQEYASDPNMQEQVQQLIQEEMSTLTRTPEEYLQDFLQHKGYTEKFLQYETPALNTSFTALSSGTPLPSGLDLSRYKLDGPSSSASSKGDLAAWKKSIENAQAQLEHQMNRTANLELLKKFGAVGWKLHNEQLTSLKNSLAQQLAQVNEQIELVNRKRKAQQVGVAGELQAVENGYYSLIWKNHEIEHACLKLKQQLGQADEEGNDVNQPNKQQKV